MNAEVEVVRHYGEVHPDVLVALRVEPATPPRVVALLSPEDFDDHADALRRLVARPEGLEIERSRWSASHLQEIAAEIHNLARTAGVGVVKQCGPGWGSVDVMLRADQEALAADLDHRYGDAIRLTVGQFPYPPARPPTLAEQIEATMTSFPRFLRPAAPSRPQARPIPGLETQLKLTPDKIRAGCDGHGQVVLRNAGTTRLEIHTDQPLVGAVTDPATGETVGGGRMWIAGTGLLLALEPGQEASIHVLFSTASRRRELGYALPPGRYLVRTEVPIHTQAPEPNGPAQLLPVSPAELIITE